MGWPEEARKGLLRILGIAPAQLGVGTRRPAVTRSRDGSPASGPRSSAIPAGPSLWCWGSAPQAVYEPVARGRAVQAEWDHFFRD